MHVAMVARGVPPDAAWAWWTDFREGPDDHAFARWATPDRRVERRDDGLVLTEVATVLGFQYLEHNAVRLARPRLHFDARNNFGRFRGHFRFFPEAGGSTRIEVTWEQDLVRWLRWLGPLGRWGVRWFYRWDLRHHVRDLEREAARPGGAGDAGPGQA